MNEKERKSCINTIKLLRRLALNIHGYIDVIDNANCDKLIGILEGESVKALLPDESNAVRWIPLTTRPMDDDEKELYKEQLEYVDDARIFNCPLPDDEQEVLITVYGRTEVDTFIKDENDGCYFECRDIEDVRAWMSLPEPYKTEGEDKECREHWIDNHNDTISCSHCHTWFYKDDRYSYMRYCPCCNTKMTEIEGKE